MSSKKRRSIEEEGESLLRRGALVRVEDLLRVIHEVNPTGHELPAPVAKRRYALKAQLQNLLVRDYKNELMVEVVPDQEGVVGLRYRPQDRDACHAVVAELDDDARSWVRLTLDLAEVDVLEPSGPAPASVVKRPSRSSDAASADLLRAAQVALDEYDYDLARHHLTSAFELSDGDVAESLALLGFLVDSIAAYRDALACESTLGPKAIKDGEVRALLAFAAANEGTPEETRRLLLGAQGRRAADACLNLCRAALKTGDVENANLWLERSKTFEARHSEAIALTDEIAAKRAASRRPREAELELLASQGDEEATRRSAASLLDSWPDSSLARRILREVEERTRLNRAEAYRLAAEQAISSREFEAALSQFQLAIEQGATGLEPRVVIARAALEETRAVATIANVASRLQAGISAEALRKYAGLSKELRERIRVEAATPELQWLEELVTSGSVQELSALITAVLALGEASRCTSSPLEVLALLEAHQELVLRARIGRELLSQARAGRDALNREAAMVDLSDARSAFESCRYDEVIRLTDSIQTRRLPEELKEEALALGGRASTALAKVSHRREFTALMESKRFWDALEIARSTTDNDSFWELQRAALADQLQRAAQLEVFDSTTPAAAPELNKRSFEEGVTLTVDPSGQTAYLVSSFGLHLFIQEYRLSDGAVTRQVALCTPEVLDFCRAVLDGTSLWVTGASGALVELSTENWRILRWRGSKGLVGEGEVVEHVVRVPATRFLWLSVRVRFSADEVVRIFDLERSRVHRELRGGFILSVVPRPGGVAICLPGTKNDGRLLSDTGVVEQTLPPNTRECVVSPNGQGLVLARPEGDEDEDEDEGTIHLMLLNRSGSVVATVEVPDSWSEGPLTLATSLEAGATYILYTNGSGSDSLAGYELVGDEFNLLFRSPVPSETSLLQDAGSTHAVLVIPGEVAPTLALLGREPPGRLEEHFAEVPSVPFMVSREFCYGSADVDTAAAVKEIKAKGTESARRRGVDEYLHRAESPEAVVQLSHALRSNDLLPEAAQALEFAIARFADDASVRLEAADVAASENDWERVLERTERVDPQPLGKGDAHFHHLRGKAQYCLGRLTEACGEFELASKVDDDPCEGAKWLPWLRALTEVERGHVVAPVSRAERLLTAIQAADARLAEGDGVGAQALLDRGLFWSVYERQVAGRLAHSVLLQNSEMTCFRKRLVLAAFLEERMTAFDRYRRSLPLGAMSWSEQKLEEVAEAARVWLKEPRGGVVD